MARQNAQQGLIPKDLALSSLATNKIVATNIVARNITTKTLTAEEADIKDLVNHVFEVSGPGTFELTQSGTYLVADNLPKTLLLPDLTQSLNWQFTISTLLGTPFAFTDGFVGDAPTGPGLAQDDTFLYVGGSFSSLLDVPRNNIGRLIKATGQIDASWNPDADNTVKSIVLDSTNDLVYVGGQFTTIGGQSRNRIARLLVSDGSADVSWNPNASDTVYTMVLDAANGLVYVGGFFTTIGAAPGPVARNRIARLLVSDGTADTWNPNANQGVYVLVLDAANGLVYVSGAFTTIGAAPGPVARNRIARLLVSDGTADTWNPNAGSIVYAIEVDFPNDLVYAGGNFTTIGGQSRNRIARLSISDGTADTWDPNANNPVYILLLDSANELLYAGGNFTVIGGQPRNRIARLSVSDSTADAWNPNANSNVYILLLDSEWSCLCRRSLFHHGGLPNWFACKITHTGHTCPDCLVFPDLPGCHSVPVHPALRDDNAQGSVVYAVASIATDGISANPNKM